MQKQPHSTDPNIESEFGVPFAGVILPQEQWAKTALKRLPEAGAIDFVQLFGRDAPRVVGYRLWQWAFFIVERRQAT